MNPPQTSGARRKFAEFDYEPQARKHGGVSLSCTFVCVMRIVPACRFLQDFRNSLFCLLIVGRMVFLFIIAFGKLSLILLRYEFLSPQGPA